VPDSSSNIIRLLRAELATEAAAGFPRLKRIPQTKTIQFLDYYAGLEAPSASALLDALAVRAESSLFPGRDRIAPRPPAFDRYWDETNRPGPLSGGYRYCDVKFLSMVPHVPEFGGYDGWINSCGFTGLCLEPRADLLPSLDALKPAKTPLLRKLIDAALKKYGFALQKGSAERKYVADTGDTISIDLGSSVMGQLRYGMTVNRPTHTLPIWRWSYEQTLWSLVGGWDYLTEENAERCIALLPELADYFAGLADRLNGVA
jgi:hypothetical protein